MFLPLAVDAAVHCPVYPVLLYVYKEKCEWSMFYASFMFQNLPGIHESNISSELLFLLFIITFSLLWQFHRNISYSDHSHPPLFFLIPFYISIGIISNFPIIRVCSWEMFGLVWLVHVIILKKKCLQIENKNLRTFAHIQSTWKGMILSLFQGNSEPPKT